MKVWQFHQFIHLEKGPVNTALFDFLKGNIFQIQNSEIEKFNNKKYKEVADLISNLKREELVIEVDEKSWIPRKTFNVLDFENDITPNEIEVEEGVNLEKIQILFNGIDFKRIIYYGKINQKKIFPHVNKIQKTKDFKECFKLSYINDKFSKINQEYYSFNKKYNSCWGKKISITKDGKIRPCIYSKIVIGDIKKYQKVEKIFNEIKKYWELTKDKVEVCKDCELRYACFDCREIARIKGNNLYSSNLFCKYDPFKGKWNV